MTTLRDYIEQMRESGFRDVADTMDILIDEPDIFDIDTSEMPVHGKRGYCFRAGCILGREYVLEGTEAENPEGRRAIVETLQNRGDRRLADAFEYAWARRDELEDDDFDYTEIPLDKESLFVFTTGINFAIAHERSRNTA